MAKKVKSISFNDTLPEEKEMLKFVSRRNFSRYVKKLIKQDMGDRMSLKSSKKLQQEQEPSSETPTSPKKNLYQHYR
jgi:hypothetical protein